MNKIYLLFLLNLALLPIHICSYNMHPPKLTIIIVVDQFAHHYINKLQSQFKYGLKYLLNNGVVYTNAFMPHGQPGTAVGHAGLNTGTYAKDHGFISNAWYTESGEKVNCDDDSSLNTQVIVPNEDNTVYDYGKSPHFLMVDGISDQCVMQSTPNSPFWCFSISGKSRSAIATASELGKAIWFDSDSGLFTSSKAYFDELPLWLKDFNETDNINTAGSIFWQRMYPKSPRAYDFFNINNYDYSRKASMVDKSLPVPDLSHPKNPYHLFEKTPQANKQLLDLAQVCIKNHVSRKTKDRLLLWVCLSPLDKLTHIYGPNSLESIDMIYHLDKQLQKFIRFALKSVGKHQVIFTLTADHGIIPIPEILHDEGLTMAQRINPKEDFVNPLNEELEQLYDIPDIIKTVKGQELILNPSLMAEIDEEDKQQIIDDIKKSISQNPLIQQAWSFDELSIMPTHSNTIENNIKNQLFRGRSGQIIIQPRTYSLFTTDAKGTSHSRLPYNYNTHVPLILFHPGKFERKYVRQRVTTLQLANTLSELLNISKPSASTAEILPELFDPEYQ